MHTISAYTEVREGLPWFVVILFFIAVLVLTIYLLPSHLKKPLPIIVAAFCSIFGTAIFLQIFLNPIRELYHNPIEVFKNIVQRIELDFEPAITDKPTISITTPIGGETYLKGNSYPITWHFDMKHKDAYQNIQGQITLERLRAKEGFLDVRVVSELNKQAIYNGSHTFLVGRETSVSGYWVGNIKGPYKVRINIWGWAECSAMRESAGKCPPHFRVEYTTSEPINFE